MNEITIYKNTYEAMTDSLIVGDKFNKIHQHVLRDAGILLNIDKIDTQNDYILLTMSFGGGLL